ncbi:MAG: heavy-metal-associated domain-containing protein [Veillonella sp.]|uniref:heavy-metal-associated domain-containing protein n=1 Tax=Veillonella sp. TaxID=1926307 RepID=UPI0025E53E7B|nr:heavy-metal-associated domain-containing protein [Veillonella sp.]MBS4914321.1 heavy-metal-associated domain-containing protein [Veillonella sp.]
MCKDCGCGSTEHAHSQVFNVPGMMCSNCENTVKTAVLGLPGVMSVDVNLESKDVTVSYDANKVNANAISDAIDATGFDVASVSEATHTHGATVGSVK